MRSVIVLTMLAMLGCTSTDPQPKRSDAPHPACDVRDEDTRCEVDDDCEYLGTRVEDSGACCYTACGGGATVNRAAAKRLLPERDRINGPRPPAGCKYAESKCAAGYPTCVAGRCTMRQD
jgi:hypothetical protein